MGKEVINTSTIVSAIVGFGAALVVCLVLFIFIYESPKSGADIPLEEPDMNSVETPMPGIPNSEVKASDINSLAIQTVYKGFHEKDSKCSKSYNELFGNDDEVFSDNSPCTVRISIERDSRATKSIEIHRYDRTNRERRIIEKSEWTAKATSAQFNALATLIVNNTAFTNWRGGTNINTSNCSISVKHAGGIKTVMSNVDENTTAYLPMVEAFKELNRNLAWKN